MVIAEDDGTADGSETWISYEGSGLKVKEEREDVDLMVLFVGS